MIILTMAQLHAPVQRFSNVGCDPKVFFQTGVKGIGGSWIEGCGNQIQDLSVVCHFVGFERSWSSRFREEVITDSYTCIRQKSMNKALQSWLNLSIYIQIMLILLTRWKHLDVLELLDVTGVNDIDLSNMTVAEEVPPWYYSCPTKDDVKTLTDYLSHCHSPLHEDGGFCDNFIVRVDNETIGAMPDNMEIEPHLSAGLWQADTPCLSLRLD